MSKVYKKQVNDLELLVPNFKVASAIIHFDETIPHLHIVVYSLLNIKIKMVWKNKLENSMFLLKNL